MITVKIKNGCKKFDSLKQVAEWLLKNNYKYVKRIKDLPARERKEYEKSILPAIRKTKTGYIWVIIK